LHLAGTGQEIQWFAREEVDVCHPAAEKGIKMFACVNFHHR